MERELEIRNKELEQTGKKIKESEASKSIYSPIRENLRSIVEEQDLIYPNYTIRMNLISLRKGLDLLKQDLFADYRGEEKISIKELCKIFERKPLSLNVETAENLSRYLIEPRDQPSLVYNRYLEKPIVEARIKLDSFLGIDYPHEFYNKIEETHNDILTVLIKLLIISLEN